MTIINGVFGGGTAIGSAGNITFQRHPAGNLARVKTSPTNPNTTPQQEARAVWSEIMERWRDALSIPQRDAWQSFALGAQTRGRRNYPHFITGRQAFIRANVIPRRAGFPFIDNPPNTPGLALTPVITILSDTTDGLRITAITPALAADDILQTQESVIYQTTRNYFKGPFFSVKFWLATDPLPFVLIPGIDISVGQRRFIRTSIVNATTGRRAIPVIYRVDATA